MNDQMYQRLREAAWRRKLTDAEQAQLSTWLAAHPEARADWEDESGLNALLARLPDAPVPSNFTARVLQALAREDAARGKTHSRSWVWRVFVPRFGIALAVVSAGTLFIHQRHVHAERLELAQSIAAVADVRALPRPEFLQDFDAIQRLLPSPQADSELLALMQ